MKKVLLIYLAFIITIAFCTCNKKTNNSEKNLHERANVEERIVSRISPAPPANHQTVAPGISPQPVQTTGGSNSSSAGLKDNTTKPSSYTYTPVQNTAAKGYQYVIYDGFIYYTVQTSDASFCLYRMNPDGTGAVRLTVLGEYPSFFSASRNRIFFNYNGEEGYGVYSVKVDGTDLVFCIDGPIDGLTATDDYLLGIGMIIDEDIGSTIYRMDRNEIENNAGKTYISTYSLGEGTSVMSLGGQNPYLCLDVISNWVYYIDIDSTTAEYGSYDLYRVRIDGSQRELLYHSGKNDVAILIGSYMGTVYYYIDGLWASKLIGWNEKDGAVEFDIAKAFAISDGYIYYVSENETRRYHIDSLKSEKILNFAVSHAEIVGDWIFYTTGEGLNAVSMMVSKNGGKPQTVPGYGEYDYTQQEGDFVDWKIATAGSGNVCLLVRAYSEPACYRLYSVDANGNGDKMVLQTFLEPYTVCRMYFNAGDYILKTASGTRWINDAEAFGPNGLYSTTKVYTFMEGMQYEIFSSYTSGSFYKSSKDDFTR